MGKDRELWGHKAMLLPHQKIQSAWERWEKKQWWKGPREVLRSGADSRARQNSMHCGRDSIQGHWGCTKPHHKTPDMASAQAHASDGPTGEVQGHLMRKWLKTLTLSNKVLVQKVAWQTNHKFKDGRVEIIQLNKNETRQSFLLNSI